MGPGYRDAGMPWDRFAFPTPAIEADTLHLRRLPMKSFATRSQTTGRLALRLALPGLCLALLAAAPSNAAAQIPAPMGTAQNFAVLGATTVTNTGSSVLTGDLGVSPGTAITGFPPGDVVSGSIEDADAVALQAESDATTAYNNLSSQACTATYATPTDLGGLTLYAGVYCFASSAQITGTLTLDALGDANAVFIFKMGSTLTTATASSVMLINGAQACKAFWQVGSSATVGTGTHFNGTIIATASITMGTNASLYGRALALTGAVTLDTNDISITTCNHACWEITSKVTHTIMVAPPVADAKGSITRGTVVGAALALDGGTVWVTGYHSPTQPGFVSVLDIATHKVGASYPVGASPSDIVFSWGTRAWVTNMYDSTLSQIDLLNHRLLAPLHVGAPGSHYPFGGTFLGVHLLVTDLGNSNSVLLYNTKATPVLSNVVPVGGRSSHPVVVPSNATYLAQKMLVPAFVADGTSGKGHPALHIVNPFNGSSTSISLLSSGAVPEAVVVTPDGRYAYVSLFDSTGGPGGVWVIDLKAMATRKVIDTGDSANFGEAMSADGTYLLVAGFSRSQVALIYTASNSVDNIIQGGEQPNAIALTADSSEAYVTNRTDGTVTVISFSPHL
jgi:DNA-binding beta-propeller fold protein YncE